MHEKHLRGVDLNLLTLLDALLRYGGVGAAASAVNLSQPATSRALGRLRAAGEPGPGLKLENFKELLDELRIARGRNHGVHAVAELHQADASLQIHGQAANAFQGRSPGVIECDLDIVRYELAVVRDRQLQLNPSPEESTSSRSEPPLDS